MIRIRLLVMALAIILVFYLLISTFTSSQRYLSPTEVLMGEYEGKTIAVIGIVKDLKVEGVNLVFTVSDSKTRLIVRYYYGSQASIKDGGEVVVEGIYSGGELLASKILTKCPSRYGSIGYVDLGDIIIPLVISILISIILVLAVIMVERRYR